MGTQLDSIQYRRIIQKLGKLLGQLSEDGGYPFDCFELEKALDAMLEGTFELSVVERRLFLHTLKGARARAQTLERMLIQEDEMQGRPCDETFGRILKDHPEWIPSRSTTIKYFFMPGWKKENGDVAYLYRRGKSRTFEMNWACPKSDTFAPGSVAIVRILDHK